MRKFLGTIVLVGLILAVVGAARNWFSLQSVDVEGATEVHLRIDREKILTDTANAKDIARELGENLEQRLESKPAANPE
jgi:hypothetical protein